MSYVTNNYSKKYNSDQSHTIEGNYSVSIDLSNWKNSIGKDLYNDGIHRIYVSDLDNTSGVLIIYFRSIGEYSLNKATLISGARHNTFGERSFTRVMSADMTAEYKGKTYECSVAGMDMNFRNGDMFGFYIFPTVESYKESLNEKGIVNLTVTDLYENIWIKQ